MEIRISLPAAAASPGQHDPERVIRDVLTRNEAVFVEPFGGACTVRVIEDGSGVQLHGVHHGMVRLAIGGCRDIVEEIPFSVDWGRRLLVAHIPEGP